MVSNFDDLENASNNAPPQQDTENDGQESSGYTVGKVLEKGQKVVYNGVKSEITAINDNGTVDVQELESPGKDLNGEPLKARWFFKIDPAGVEV